MDDKDDVHIVLSPKKLPTVQKYTLSSLVDTFDSAVVDALRFLQEIIRDSSVDEEIRVKAAFTIIRSGEYLTRRSQIGSEIEDIY